VANYETAPQRSHGHSEICQKNHFSDVLNLQPGAPHCNATHGEPEVTLLFETGHMRYCSGSLQFCVNSTAFLQQRSLVRGILLFLKILRSELLFINPVTSTLRSMRFVASRLNMKFLVHHLSKENTSTRSLPCHKSTAAFFHSEFSTG
jgi:hypothetical protein